MMEIHVDTIKMRECGQDIIKLSEALRTVIDTMFDRINNMPINTKEWFGTSARVFARLSAADKMQYVELRDALYKHGKYLIECADNFELSMRKMRRQ